MDRLENHKGIFRNTRYVVDNSCNKGRYGGFRLTRKVCTGILLYQSESLSVAISAICKTQTLGVQKFR